MLQVGAGLDGRYPANLRIAGFNGCAKGVATRVLVEVEVGDFEDMGLEDLRALELERHLRLLRPI